MGLSPHPARLDFVRPPFSCTPTHCTPTHCTASFSTGARPPKTVGTVSGATGYFSSSTVTAALTSSGSSPYDRPPRAKEGAAKMPSDRKPTENQIQQLSALQDREPNTQDIPEAPAGNWQHTKRGAF